MKFKGAPSYNVAEARHCLANAISLVDEMTSIEALLIHVESEKFVVNDTCRLAELGIHTMTFTLIVFIGFQALVFSFGL